MKYCFFSIELMYTIKVNIFLSIKSQVLASHSLRLSAVLCVRYSLLVLKLRSGGCGLRLPTRVGYTHTGQGVRQRFSIQDIIHKIGQINMIYKTCPIITNDLGSVSIYCSSRLQTPTAQYHSCWALRKVGY